MRYLRRQPFPGKPVGWAGWFEEIHEVTDDDVICRVICFYSDGTVMAWVSNSKLWWSPKQLGGSITREKFDALYTLYGDRPRII